MKHFTYIMLLFAIIISGCDNTTPDPEQTGEFRKMYSLFSENVASEVVKLDDGGYAIVGTTKTNLEDQDISLIITDEYGNSKYSIKLFGGDYDDYGYGIQALPDNRGFLICGSYQYSENGDRDIYIIRTDQFGDTILTKKYGGSGNDEAFDIEMTSAGDYIITGYTESRDNGIGGNEGKNAFLFKIDSLGNNLWNALIPNGGSGNETGNDVTEHNGQLYMVGSTTSSLGSPSGETSELYIVKAEENGRLSFYYPLSFKSHKEGNKIKILPNGDIYGIGTYYGQTNNNSDIYVFKTHTDLLGLDSLIWETNIGFDNNDEGENLIIQDDQLVLLGTIGFSSSTSKIALISMDMEGNDYEYKYFGESVEAKANSFVRTDDHGFLICGSVKNNDVYSVTLIKTK